MVAPSRDSRTCAPVSRAGSAVSMKTERSPAIVALRSSRRMLMVGASAPAKQLFEHFRFTTDDVVRTVNGLL